MFVVSWFVFVVSVLIDLVELVLVLLYWLG